MILQRNGLRLLVEMAVIVATAAVTGFAHLAAWAIVGSVVVVWLAISVFEYSRSHLRVKRRSRSGAAAGPPAEHLPPTESIFERVERVRVLPAGQARSVPAVAAETDASSAGPPPAAAAPPAAEAPEAVEADVEPFAESVRVLSGSRREPADEPVDEHTLFAAAPEELEPESEPKPEPEPEPVEPEQVAAHAEPEPEPATAAAPEPAVALDDQPVAGLDVEREPAPALASEPWPERRGVAEEEPVREAAHYEPVRRELDEEPAQSREAEPDHVPVGVAAWSWNVWNLERVVRERASSNEELNYLLLYLRDYANPAGMLPPDFDALVRESFGDLLAAPA